ncbi:MAG TPA: AlpA family transcriptional regulator [Sphingobium sp.]
MTQDHILQTPDRFLRIEAVLHRTGLSRATLYRKVRQGTFPKQVRIAERCVGWRESAINDWQRDPFSYPFRPEHAAEPCESLLFEPSLLAR